MEKRRRMRERERERDLSLLKTVFTLYSLFRVTPLRKGFSHTTCDYDRRLYINREKIKSLSRCACMRKYMFKEKKDVCVCARGGKQI